MVGKLQNLDSIDIVQCVWVLSALEAISYTISIRGGGEEKFGFRYICGAHGYPLIGFTGKGFIFIAIVA